MQRIRVISQKVLRTVSALITQKNAFTIYAVLLLAIMAVAYDLFLPRIGYYYDDWEVVLLQKQQFSFSQIWQYFLIDRPFSSLVHVALNPILGSSPVPWRIFGLLIHWAAVLFFVSSLRLIWPKRQVEIGWIGLLLAVYPGITRQFVIRTSLVHFVSMLLFTLSIWLMLKAVQNKNVLWMLIPSLILSALQMLIIEYFAGLELIRGFLLLYVFKQEIPDWRAAITKTLRSWLPFLLVFFGFIFFRLQILPQIQQEGMQAKNAPWVIAQLLQDPANYLLQPIEVILQDSVYAVFYVWSQIFVPEELDLNARTTVASWLIGALVAAIVAGFMTFWYQKTKTEEQKIHYPGFLLLLCLAAILLGGLPIWAVGRQAIKGLWASRYLFGIVMGAVPLLVVTMLWLFGRQRTRMSNLVFAVLLMGSIAFQIRTANTYALTWHYAKDYFWQLKWRAPDLQENTFILSPYTPFQFSADYEIAFAFNVLYNSGSQDTHMRYWWFDGPDDLINYQTRQYPTSMDIDHQFRNITFKSDMQHALGVIYKPARSCLQVIDPVYQHEPLLLGEENQLFPVANPGLVIQQEENVPEDVFGREPAHNWCYIFQKGDLARFNQQWEQVVALWQEAEQRNLTPTYGPEYLPFIEGYAHLGDWQQSASLTNAAQEKTENMAAFLCQNWERINTDTPASDQKLQVITQIQNQLRCSELTTNQ